jgi:hypothetical protein
MNGLDTHPAQMEDCVDRFVGLRLFPVRQFPSRGLFVTFTIPGVHGVVDIFDMTGNLLKNLTSASELKAPLGISACARAIRPRQRWCVGGELARWPHQRF